MSNRWLEITTNIGCFMKCVYCPQDKLLKAYKGEQIMRMSTFMTMIEKVPEDVDIMFAGYSEPFLNPYCYAMMAYAQYLGHKVILYTTGVGLVNPEKVNELDCEVYKHVIGKSRLDVMSKLKGSNVRPQLHDRAGNLPMFPEGYKYSSLTPSKKREVTKCNNSPTMECGVLLPNGDIQLCCQDYSLKHTLGNLIEEDYGVIMKRAKIVSLCKTCAYGKEEDV